MKDLLTLSSRLFGTFYALLSGMDLDLENFWSLLLCCLDWCFAVGGELCCRRGVLGLGYFVEIGLVLLGLGRFGSDG